MQWYIITGIVIISIFHGMRHLKPTPRLSFHHPDPDAEEKSMVVVANYKNRRPERQSRRPRVCCHLHCWASILILFFIFCLIKIMIIFTINLLWIYVKLKHNHIFGCKKILLSAATYIALPQSSSFPWSSLFIHLWKLATYHSQVCGLNKSLLRKTKLSFSLWFDWALCKW